MFESIGNGPDLRSTIRSRIMDWGGRLRVRSALNPALWLCAIVTSPIVMVALFSNNVPIWIILIACAPVALAVIGFIYFLLRDPDKLQSEDYQLRKRSLELIEEKGDLQPIVADTLVAIANPQKKLLASKDQEQDL